MIPEIADHTVIATGNLLRQFWGAKNLRALVAGLTVGLNGVDQAYHQLISLRTLDTATGKQLDGIGVILGQSRYLQAVDYIYFGFEDQTASDTFGKAPLRDANQQAGYAVAVSDDVYRLVLRAKIILNSGAGTIEDIISVCKLLFGATQVIVDTSVKGQVTVKATPAADVSEAILQSAASLIPLAAGVTLILDI